MSDDKVIGFRLFQSYILRTVFCALQRLHNIMLFYCVFVFITPTLPFFVSLRLYLFVCLFVKLPLFSISLSLSICLFSSFFLFLSSSLCLSFSITLFLSLSLSLSFSLSLSLFLFLSPSLTLSLSLLFSLLFSQRSTNNRDLLSDRNHWKYKKYRQTHRLKLILSPYTIKGLVKKTVSLDPSDSRFEPATFQSQVHRSTD